MSNSKKQYNILTDDDLEEIEGAYPAKYYNQEVLFGILKTNPEYLHKARLWGWDDTELGDEIYVAVQKLEVEFEKPRN